jgi:KUP system potassium uptake protein
MLLAAVVFGMMATWHRGIVAVADALSERAEKVPDFLARVAAANIPRVPGTAVFMTRTSEDTPPVMTWHVRNNRALHTFLVALNVQVRSIPYVDPSERVTVLKQGDNFWRLTARYGFMEQPDIPALIAAAHSKGCSIHMEDVTYYLGHETLLHRTDGKGLPLWRELIFAFMMRNAAHSAEFFRLPREGVVEIGRQVEI